MQSLLIFTILSFALSAFGQGFQPTDVAFMAQRKIVAGIAQTFLIDERFEAAGCPANWTMFNNGGASYNCNYTTTALEASQSLLMPGTGGAFLSYGKTPSFTGNADCYISFRIRLTTAAGNFDTMMYCLTDSDVSATSVLFQTGGNLKIRSNGGSYSAATGQALGSDKTYYLKIHFKQGSGSNALSELWVAPDQTSWGTAVSSTDGTATGQVLKLEFYNGVSETTGYIVDKVRVSATDIAIGDS